MDDRKDGGGGAPPGADLWGSQERPLHEWPPTPSVPAESPLLSSPCRRPSVHPPAGAHPSEPALPLEIPVQSPREGLSKRVHLISPTGSRLYFHLPWMRSESPCSGPGGEQAARTDRTNTSGSLCGSTERSTARRPHNTHSRRGSPSPLRQPHGSSRGFAGLQREALMHV